MAFLIRLEAGSISTYILKISFVFVFFLIQTLTGWTKTNVKSEFDIIPLNSPVKESIAKFLFKAPKDLVIKDILFKVMPATDLIQKDSHYTQTKLVNSPQGKELHITMVDSRIGFYRLYVIIKTNKAEYQFQTAYTNYVKFVYEKNLKNVPEPNSEINNSTLLGVDSDNDGIRDDVQNWINANSKEGPVRLALRQYAFRIRNKYANKDNKEHSIIATHESLKAQDCLSDIKSEAGENNRASLELEAFHRNTKERIMASNQISSTFHGQLIEIVDKELACDF